MPWQSADSSAQAKQYGSMNQKKVACCGHFNIIGFGELEYWSIGVLESW